MKPFATFQVDPLLTLLDHLAQSSTHVRSVYKFSLLVPDLVLYQNGVPDAWFFSNKKEIIESRPITSLSNQAIFRYFKKHSAIPSLAGIVRIKVQDEKYYSLIDVATLQKVLSGPSDGPPLQMWDSLSFFMPFLKGGIFTATWKDGDVNLFKHEVYGYNDPVFQQAILGVFPPR